MRVIIIVLISLISLSLNGKSDSGSRYKAKIQINTKSGTIKVNGQVLKSFRLKDIEAIFGKAQRKKVLVEDIEMKEYPADNEDSFAFYTIQVKSYYYIYDELGVMFLSDTSELANKEPAFLYIYANKRDFTHDLYPPKHWPKKRFRGLLAINGTKLYPDKPLTLPNINYRTPSFSYLNTTFRPSSRASYIDSIGSYDKKMGIELYLNNPRENKLSYIRISVKRKD